MVAAISVWLWVQNVVFFLHDLEAWELANELRDRCDVVDEWANHAHASCIMHGVYGIFGSRLVSSLDEFFPHAVGRLDARFPR